MSGGVKTGINRPIFPTLGNSPENQRLLAAVNEVVTAMLTSGALLGRMPPGDILRPKNGTMALAWGRQNRVDVGVSTGIAQLPAIRPELIGQPLYMSKLSPSGTVTVLASGKATDGRSVPMVDGSPTGIQRQAAGLSTLQTDGQNWYSISGGATSRVTVEGNPIAIREVPTATLLLAAPDAFKYLRFTYPSGCMVTVPSGVFQPGTWTHTYTAASGVVSYTGAGLTILKPASCVRQSAEQGALVTIFFNDSGNVDLFGDLGLA